MPILGELVRGRISHVSFLVTFILLALAPWHAIAAPPSLPFIPTIQLHDRELLHSLPPASSRADFVPAMASLSAGSSPAAQLEALQRQHHHQHLEPRPRHTYQESIRFPTKRDPKANGMSLSITNNMDVLRSKFLRELIQRRENKFRQSWVRNQELLDDIGKRKK